MLAGHIAVTTSSYTYIKPSYCPPETYTVLQVNYFSIKLWETKFLKPSTLLNHSPLAQFLSHVNIK